MKSGMNVILTGMPGAGKSTAGVLLAKTLGMSFIDTDLILQTNAGMKLCDILALRGAEEFGRLENEALLSVEADNAVIATGGSAVFCESGMAHLKNNGTVVYLDVPLPELEKRLTGIRTRGVVMKEGETLAQLLEERLPYYERYADVTVRESGGTEETVAAIAEAVATRREKRN